MANQPLTISTLDFDSIKNNLKTFLKSQTEFQDYDFEGAGLNILLDILAYNTHYNAYYLNMVANESFMDSAVLRDSVVSHAKNLSYVPASKNSAKAIINLTVSGSETAESTLTLPRGFNFRSGQIDNRSYNFVLLQDATVTRANNNFYFENLEIREGELLIYNFINDEVTNPKAIFTIPDPNIDTKTMVVTVRGSVSNTSFEVYEVSDDVTDLNSESKVYFLQEGRNGNYQIYFGDNVLGKRPANQSVITVEYLSTSGQDANKASSFIISDATNEINNYTLSLVSAASGGSLRESLDTIKSLAPLHYSSQNRLVTFRDYQNYLLNNYVGLDSISVWGGEDETPPIYGKIFIALKPKEGFFLSETEKERIIRDIITPKAMPTITTEIVDPEFLYLYVTTNVRYNPSKSSFTPEGLKSAIKNVMLSYRDNFLNKFGSTFVVSKFQELIDNVELNSIIGSSSSVRIQRRIEPSLNVSRNYVINFGTSLNQPTPLNKLSSTEFSVFDSSGVLRSVFVEEIPKSFSGISSIEVVQSGRNYTSVPTVTIVGDGNGASAKAVLTDGKIERIDIIDGGVDYTSATVSITGGGGTGAIANAIVDYEKGLLRAVYYTSASERVTVIPRLGEINYTTGKVTLSDLKVVTSNTSDGLISVTCGVKDSLIAVGRSTILTLEDGSPIINLINV